MRFRHVRLDTAATAATAVHDFYTSALGFTAIDPQTLRAGESALSFRPAGGGPFYHVAFLAPGDRFDAALAWARPRVALLPSPHTGDVAFDFPAWDARALYFHDPAGNIVELIAHHGIGENGRRGEFDARELVGVSELGLVGDPQDLATRLGRELGLELWDGEVEHGGRLGFVGSRGRTFVVSAPGRGWLPTGRPAEAHPVDVVIDDVVRGGTVRSAGLIVRSRG